MTEAQNFVPPLRRFDGRIALVTGAGGPMGEGIARRFAAEGARLVLTDISERRLAANAERLNADFPSTVVLAHRASVIIEDEVDALCARLTGTPVHMLINVVGGIRDKDIFKSVYEITGERWDETFNLNLKGIFYLVRRLCPSMQQRGHGSVVNISSMVYSGESLQTDYAAAKAAVGSLTRSLALEFAPVVRVNCVAPGFIATNFADRISEEERRMLLDRVPLKRLGRPEDIAAAVAFLASDDAAFITGTILPVTGGIWPAL